MPFPAQQPAQELTKTATIRNRANLKKNTLRLVPLGGDPTKLLITFVFDNSAPCMCVAAAAACARAELPQIQHRVAVCSAADVSAGVKHEFVNTCTWQFAALLPCSVSTFIGGTEDPEKGCRISSPQPPPPSIQYDQGVRMFAPALYP